MDVPAFNASMAPNGAMIVWTGALLRMRDEAELAFVLGHEAGHFRAQHTLRQWRRMKDTSAFLSAFQVLAYGAGFPDAAMLGSLGLYATIFKFSRDMEREADQLGFDAVVDAGLRPASRRRPVGPHAARGEHAALRAPQHGVRHPPGDPGTHQRRARRRRRVAESAARTPRDALPRRDAALPGTLAGSGTRAAPLRQFAAGHRRTARRRAGRQTRRAHVLPRRGASPPQCCGDRAKAAELYARAIALPGAPAGGLARTRLRPAQRPAAPPKPASRCSVSEHAPQADDRAFVQRELDKLGGP